MSIPPSEVSKDSIVNETREIGIIFDTIEINLKTIKQIEAKINLFEKEEYEKNKEIVEKITFCINNRHWDNTCYKQLNSIMSYNRKTNTRVSSI